jgi:flagellar protein FliS
VAYGKFVQEYQKGAVNGASPLQLVVMLYDGALRFMEAGKHAMVHKDLEKQNYSLKKAQSIISELMACLDMQNGGDIATNLMSLYNYALSQLVQANIKDDPNCIDQALHVFSQLRESWVELEKSIKIEPQAEQRFAA